MGAHDYIVTIKETDQAKVREKWKQIQEDDLFEHGHDPYNGSSSTMHGSITFYDRRLASREEAGKFVLDKHEKWSGAVAVSYYLPAEPSKADEARKVKAREKLESTLQKNFDVLVAMQQAFINRKSGLVGCKGCGSRLSHPHLVKTLSKGHVSVFEVNYNGRPRSKTFNMPTLPVCPVCKLSLSSETDQKRLAAHDEKVKQAQTAYDEALTPKAGSQIAWAVGGWAAC